MKTGLRGTRNGEQSAELVTLLKRTMPFQIVSDALLAEIAGIARRDAYEGGQVVYRAGDLADDVYIVVSGRVEHRLQPSAQAEAAVKFLGADEVFGWAALLMNQPRRLADTTALERTEVIRLDGNALIELLGDDPDSGDVVMSRFATMINRDFTVPEGVAIPRRIRRSETAQQASRLGFTMFRLALWLRSPRPYLMLLGYALFLGFWYLAVEAWKLPRFSEMPGLTDVVGVVQQEPGLRTVDLRARIL